MMMMMIILIKGAGRGILQNHCSKPSHNIIHCRCIWSYLIRYTQNYIGRSKSITKQNWFQHSSWLIDKPQFWREREGLEIPVRSDFFPNGPHQSEIFHHEKSCHEEILQEGINWVENIQLFAKNEPCTHTHWKDLFYCSTEWIGKSPGMRFPDDDERMCDPCFLVFDNINGGGSKYCQKRQWDLNSASQLNPEIDQATMENFNS